MLMDQYSGNYSVKEYLFYHQLSELAMHRYISIHII